MLFASNATSLIQLVRVVADNDDPVTGLAHDAAGLLVSYKLQAGSAWVSPTLVEGTLGTYLPNSWKELGAGIYQWCPPNAVVVAGTSTAVRVVYGASQPLYDTIEPKLLPIELASRLAGARITIFDRVSGGTITAYVDDDYRVRSDSQLEILVDDAGGALHSKLDALGVDALSFGAAREGRPAGEITGTIAELSYADDVLTISIEISECGSGLRPGEYLYQIQSSREHVVDGVAETDDLVEVSGTLLLERRTVPIAE